MKIINQDIRSLFFPILTLLALSGCGGQSDPPANLFESPGLASLEARIFVGNTNGKVSVIEHRAAGNTLAEPIDLFSSVGDMTSSSKNHLFISMGSTNQVAALDPVGEEAAFKKFIAVGQRPVHNHRDPEGSRIWILNDGDSTSGIDTVTTACSAASKSSVSVIQNHGTAGHGDEEEESNAGEILSTICVGRGHHRITFSEPSTAAPSVPRRAFISNAMDGTFTVIDNNPASADYLKEIAGSPVSLCDSTKETCPAAPNGAGPHGMVYSPVSGKIYNYNEDYATVNVIDPTTLAVEPPLNIPFAGSPHITPDGRFVFIRGFDAATVTGKLTVIDVSNNNLTTIDLPNINAGALGFTSDGRKMYLAGSGSTARPTQRRDVVLVYDISALPALTQTKEITVGTTTAGRSIGILEHDGAATRVFATNRADGTVSVIDAATDTVADTLQVGGTPTSLFVFPMEGGLSH